MLIFITSVNICRKKVFFGCFLSVFILFGYSFADNTFADLKISEVYFHGADERIEIVNVGTGIFSGELQIVSDSTNTGIVSDLFLSSGGIAVIGQIDSTKYFLSQSCVVESGFANFDVDDSGSSTVSLVSSGITLDSVVLDGSEKNYKSSLFRSGLSMLSTSESEIYNTFHRFYMNPCSSKLLGQNNFTDRDSYLPTTSGLIISETYFDGSRERVEVTNTALSDFNGTISFVGIGNNVEVYTTTIPAQSVKVFKQSGVSYISGNVDTQNESLFNKFRDDERLSVSMFLGSTQTTGNILDIIHRTVTEIGILDDQKKSFEKIRNGSEFITSSSDPSRQYNTTDLSYIINPGAVYDNLGNIIFPIQAPIVPQTGLIKFSEIKKTDGLNTSSYVEFFVQTGVVGMVMLSGSSIGGQETWNGEFKTGGYYLFLGQSSPVIDFVKNLSTLSISDGILELYLDGSLQDTIVVSNIDNVGTGKSLYSDLSIRLSTPGLPKNFDTLLPIQQNIVTESLTETNCESAFPNSCFNPPTCPTCSSCNCGSSSCPTCSTKEELCGEEENDSSVVSISRLLINPDGADDGKEEIGLFLNSGDFLDISMWRLEYSDGKDYVFKNNSILYGGCENVFTGIATLVNSRDNCIKLFSGDVLIDKGCYKKSTKEEFFVEGLDSCISGDDDFSGGGDDYLSGSEVGNGNKTGNSLQTGQSGQITGQQDLTGNDIGYLKKDYSFKITNVVYDPDGSDVGKEQITVQNVIDDKNFDNTGNIDMSQFFILAEKRKSFLVGNMLFGEKKTFKDSFGFVNSRSMCIELRDENKLYDTYCYDPNDEAEEDDNVQTGQVIDYRQFDVSIINLIYDPKKQFGQSESIILSLNAGVDNLDVSKLRLRVNDNKTYKTIGEGFIKKGQKKTFFKNFGFPNTKNSTIYLYYKDGSKYYEYDSFSYIVPKYDENTGSLNNQTGIDESWKDREIRLRNIVYDPPGADKGKEQVDIELTKGDTVDLKYYHLNVNGVNKRIYGSLYPFKLKTLKGTYGFSNSKKTCVEIVRDDYIFDTLCYDPNTSPQTHLLTGDEHGTGAFTGKVLFGTETGLLRSSQGQRIDYSKINIQILGIDYDPAGNDNGSESIKLKYYGGEKALNLSDGFFLKIGNRNRSLKYFGNIELGQEKVLKGTFGFPNKVDTCVELWNKNGDIFLSKFCYKIEKAKKTTIRKKSSRSTRKNTKEKAFSSVEEQNKLLKIYNRVLEDELKGSRADLRYNSKLSRYSKLYKDARNFLGKGQKYREYHGVKIDIYDLETQYRILYGRDDKTRIEDWTRSMIIGKQGDDILRQ